MNEADRQAMIRAYCRTSGIRFEACIKNWPINRSQRLFQEHWLEAIDQGKEKLAVKINEIIYASGASLGSKNYFSIRILCAKAITAAMPAKEGE